MTPVGSNPVALIAVGFALALVAMSWFLFDLRRKWNRMFGRKNADRAEVLSDILQRLAQAEARLTSLEPRVDTLEAIGKVAVQKVGFLRFNPFEHTGGDQSFAVALLDRDDTGIVISSLYTRDGVRVYAKRIRNGASQHQLSAEETKVLEQAINNES